MLDLFRTYFRRYFNHYTYIGYTNDSEAGDVLQDVIGWQYRDHTKSIISIQKYSNIGDCHESCKTLSIATIKTTKNTRYTSQCTVDLYITLQSSYQIQ